MTRKILFISLVVIIVAKAVLLAGSVTAASTPAISATNPNRASADSLDAQPMLKATIHIIVYPKLLLETSEDSQQVQQNDSEAGRLVRRARGIGTVVSYGSHILIITHDHWEWMGDQLARVELRDADNDLLLEMSGEAFENIVRYRDGGTMILETPGMVLSAGIVPARLGTEEAVAAGSIVQLAYRLGEDRQYIDVQEAVVEIVSDRDGRPILNLRSLDGEPVIQGDSGGGVWYGGKLVGNLWKMVRVETVSRETRFWGTREVVETTADRSIAALFPLDDLGLESNLAIDSPPEYGER